MKLCHLTAAVGIAAALLPQLLASQASAAPTEAIAFEETVEYDDLDLSTQRGVAMLESRIETRIIRLCETGGRDGTSLRLERQCRDTALASTQRQVRLAVAEANAERTRLATQKAVTVVDAPGA